MRIERQRHGSSACRARILTRLPDHALVAEMYAVEHADGQVDVMGDRASSSNVRMTCIRAS